jgi:immune inhibitor A
MGGRVGRVGRVRRVAWLILVSILLAGCSPFWAQKTSSATPTPATSSTAPCPVWARTTAPAIAAPQQGADARAVAEYNASRVLQTTRPVRNLYAITQYLVKHLSSAVPCRVRSQPRNERVGDVRTFWVVTSSLTGYRQTSAKLVYVTPHLYMYLEQGVNTSTSALRASADLFERSIYQTDRRSYGAEWSPGPDADAHITVLNATDLGPIGGYFSSEDEYPRVVSQYSNERQMIYINLDGGAVPGTEFYNSTLAHEFQHMIHWYWHPGDDSWTNEGMSVLAQHLNQYTDGGVANAFLNQPDTMLGGWTDSPHENVKHYGAGYLFMDYFAEHYGGYPVLRELLSSPLQVPLNFDAVLQAHGFKDRFDDVFAKFVMANLLNDPGVAGGVYAYPTLPGIHAVPQQTVQRYPYAAGAASVQQYAARYYDFKPSGSARTLSVDFRGSPTVPIVDNRPYGGASAEWWSNSGNEMASTLARAFDLSKAAGKQVTLNFQAWYDLEQDFDYVYVEVSTDGGHNWTPLRTSASSEMNPNGLNVGHGITGRSGGPNSARWVPVTVDLSAFAGKQIQLRFENITDDAVHFQGFTVDSLSIPAIGFRDDVATDGGWQARGWIRSNNVLPQQYVLQAAVYRAGQAQPQVQRIAVNAASGAAHVSWGDFGGSVTRVTLAVSALASTTVVPAQYQLTVRLG